MAERHLYTVHMDGGDGQPPIQLCSRMVSGSQCLAVIRGALANGRKLTVSTTRQYKDGEGKWVDAEPTSPKLATKRA